MDAVARIGIIDVSEVPQRTNARPVPRKDYRIAELEEQIVIGRHMLFTNQGDREEIENFLRAAAPIYRKYLFETLKLTHINAKIARPPILPIVFSAEETSELYWTRVQYGNLENILRRVEQGFRQIEARLFVRLSNCDLEEMVPVSRCIGNIKEALQQWRPRAEAAVNERCNDMQDQIRTEIGREMARARARETVRESANAGGVEVIDGTDW